MTTLIDFAGTDLAYFLHGQGQRPWGYEVRIAVFDKNQPLTDENDPDYEFGYRHLRGLTATFKTQPAQAHLDSDVTRRLTGFNAKLIWEDNKADITGISEEVKDALIWLVKKIRTNPEATVDQARTVWNSEMAEELFDFDKLVNHIRSKVGNITWDQFKAFCVNKNFEGID